MTTTPSTALRAGIYARVSSDRQQKANTIDSQVAALRQAVIDDGLALFPDNSYIDDGYSGESLVRPALDRLRDCVADGSLDRVYVLSPDRLSRCYAHQVLLLEEFRRAGVEVAFLNRRLEATPEDDLLARVQGAIAEYERTQILERSRRGKLHAARQGRVSVLSNAPYGYRYISKHDGGDAVYQVLLEEARVVQQVFRWVGEQRWTIRRVCKELQKQETPSPKGGVKWCTSTIAGMLSNPAYKGEAGFCKTQKGQRRSRPSLDFHGAELT